MAAESPSQSFNEKQDHGSAENGSPKVDVPKLESSEGPVAVAAGKSKDLAPASFTSLFRCVTCANQVKCITDRNNYSGSPRGQSLSWMSSDLSVLQLLARHK